MRILLTTTVLVGTVTLAACSGGKVTSTTDGTSTTGAPAVRPALHSDVQSTPDVHLSGNFCADMRTLTLKSAEIARSLTTYSPEQVKTALQADAALESTAAADAPAGLREDIRLASNGPQFDALAAVGYDIRRVGADKMQLTAVQEAALTRVQQYVISTCGFDPKKLLTGSA